MKAVSNTTPLRYLIAIEQEHLLGQLFEKVFVPVAVHEELTEARTPEIVRRGVLSLPGWFEVRAVEKSQTNPFPSELHRGERQAILLAEALQVDVLLIDEQIGRTIALEPESAALGNARRARTGRQAWVGWRFPTRSATTQSEWVLHRWGSGTATLGTSSQATGSKTRERIEIGLGRPV